MENIKKELTVQKWMLTVRQKIPQMPQKMSAQNVVRAQKFETFEKKSLWVSLVRVEDKASVLLLSYG